MPRNGWYWKFKRAGMIQRGHVVLSSGRHTQVYVNCAWPLIQLDPIVDEIVGALGAYIRPTIVQSDRPIVILGTGKGAHYARLLAVWCQKRHPEHKFRFAFAQRDETGMLFLPYNQKRILAGSEIIYFDDTHHTGRTFREMQRLLKGINAAIIQYLVVVNRAKKQTIEAGEMTLIIESLLHVPNLRSWKNRASCKLCREGKKYSTSIGGGNREFHLHGQP